MRRVRVTGRRTAETTLPTGHIDRALPAGSKVEMSIGTFELVSNTDRSITVRRPRLRSRARWMRNALRSRSRAALNAWGWVGAFGAIACTCAQAVIDQSARIFYDSDVVQHHLAARIVAVPCALFALVMYIAWGSELLLWLRDRVSNGKSR